MPLGVGGGCALLSRSSMLRIPWGLWGCELRRVRLSFRPGKDKTRATRLYSSRSGDGHLESHEVICGSSGSITVDIYNSHHLATSTNPLIIHLPPTGVHLRSAHPAIPAFLFPPYPATVVSINYRWNIPSPSASASPSKTPLATHPSFAYHAFPTPLHDTLHAYTYLTNKLLPSLSPQPTDGIRRLRNQRPILVYGSHLGATLATSLSLTEAIASKSHPVRISGLIARNGIYDWTGIASSKPPETEEYELGLGGDVWNWDENELYGLREKLFSNPAGSFDTFASPVLFFRTAGVSVLMRWPGSSSSDSPSATEPYQEYLIDSAEPSPFHPDFDSEFSVERSPGSEQQTSISDSQSTPKKGDVDEEVEIARISHLKFPPRDSGLKIPRSLFLTTPSSYSSTVKTPPSFTKSSLKASLRGEETTPRSQAEQMSRLMQRSVLLHEFKERALWDESLDPHAAADDRVQLYSLSESGKLDEEGTNMIEEWIEDSLS